VSNESEELRAATRVVAHAQMLRLDDDAHTFGVKLLLQPVGDLHRDPLLDLRPPGEELDDTGPLRQTKDALPWEVTDVHNPAERQQMVLVSSSAYAAATRFSCDLVAVSQVARETGERTGSETRRARGSRAIRPALMDVLTRHGYEGPEPDACCVRLCRR
jgi:hypothetical protein